MRLLAESEARFRDFARSAAEWFWEADAEGRYTWFSGEVEQVTGFPREWHYGRTRLELAAAAGEDLESPRWRAHRERLARREPYRDFRYARRAPDGVRWISSSAVPVYDESGRFVGWRGTGRDVTEEVRLAERARLAESRLAEAVERLPHAVSLTDSEDRIVLVNDAHRKLNPGLPDGSLGKTYEEHLRAGIALGHYPEAAGREEAWLAERLAARRRRRRTAGARPPPGRRGATRQLLAPCRRRHPHDRVRRLGAGPVARADRGGARPVRSALSRGADPDVPRRTGRHDTRLQRSVQRVRRACAQGGTRQAR
ncbi:MAG: PAS domain S-box protein [Burkholderiales bacterium]|nr:PAS domain S-box protein [Burkholderiales bacterium]